MSGNAGGEDEQQQWPYSTAQPHVVAIAVDGITDGCVDGIPGYIGKAEAVEAHGTE